MSIGEHLEDLRRRLILGLVGLALAAVVGLIFGKQLLAWLCIPLLQAQRHLGLTPQAINTHPTGAFMVYLKISLIAGVVLASPWIVYQLWQFVAVGLYQHERRAVGFTVPFSALLSALGIVFMYHIMLPVCLWFFITFSASFPDVGAEQTWLFPWLVPDELPPAVEPENAGAAGGDAQAPVIRWPVLERDPAGPVEGQIWLKMPEGEARVFLGGQVRSLAFSTPTLITPLIDISAYIDFVLALTLGIVIAFQVPVVMLILGAAGLLDPAWVARYRRHCIFACFAVGTLLTPADVLSMLLLAFPLWGLFELGLLMVRWQRRGRKRAGAA